MSHNHRRIDRLRVVVMSALVAVAATVALPLIAQAQAPAGQGGGGGGGGGRMMAAMFDGITLSDAQKKSVDSIRTSYQPQMAQLRSQGESSRPQMRQLMQKETGDLRTVLTPDQQTTFDKNVANMRSRMQQQGGAGGGGTPGGGGNPQ